RRRIDALRPGADQQDLAHEQARAEELDEVDEPGRGGEGRAERDQTDPRPETHAMRRTRPGPAEPTDDEKERRPEVICTSCSARAKSKVARRESAASTTRPRAERRSGSPSPAPIRARVSPQASTASTPALGFMVKASPARKPATTSHAPPPRTR